MNPREYVKDICCVTQLGEPFVENQQQDQEGDKQGDIKEKDDQSKEQVKEKEAKSLVKAYVPHVAFPQRLKKTREDYDF